MNGTRLGTSGGQTSRQQDCGNGQEHSASAQMPSPFSESFFGKRDIFADQPDGMVQPFRIPQEQIQTIPRNQGGYSETHGIVSPE